MSAKRLEPKTVGDVYRFGFFQGREYEALDTMKAMGALSGFEDIEREVISTFMTLMEARVAAAVAAERERTGGRTSCHSCGSKDIEVVMCAPCNTARMRLVVADAVAKERERCRDIIATYASSGLELGARQVLVALVRGGK